MQTMPNKLPGKKKRRFLKAAGFCIITAAAFLLLGIVYQVNSSRRKSIESEKYIYQCIATQLNMKDMNQLNDEHFEKVRSFRIEMERVTDIKPVAKLKNLNLMEFNYDPVSPVDMNIDYGPLEELQNLRQINFAPWTHDGFVVQEAWYKRILRILKKPEPYGSRSKPFDLGKIRKLKRIEMLTVNYNKSYNFEAIANLTNLWYLSIASPEVSDISFMKGLPKLRQLGIDGTKIKDISPLSGLVNLERLTLTSAVIKDLNPLARLTRLQYLRLYSVKVENLDALSSLTNLNNLDLSYMQIKDIEPLKKLVNLKELRLKNCENISDQQIEDLQKALPDLKIVR